MTDEQKKRVEQIRWKLAAAETVQQTDIAFLLSNIDQLTAENGALKEELKDYRAMQQEWSKTLCELTNGKLSKTNYASSTMINAISGAFEELYEDNQREEKNE